MAKDYDLHEPFLFSALLRGLFKGLVKTSRKSLGLGLQPASLIGIDLVFLNQCFWTRTLNPAPFYPSVFFVTTTCQQVLQLEVGKESAAFVWSGRALPLLSVGLSMAVIWIFNLHQSSNFLIQVIHGLFWRTRSNVSVHRSDLRGDCEDNI